MIDGWANARLSIATPIAFQVYRLLRYVYPYSGYESITFSRNTVSEIYFSIKFFN